MDIYVYFDTTHDGPIYMGRLRCETSKARSTFSFEYDGEWLKGRELRVLDPDLQNFVGPQYPSPRQPNFGIFRDSSPDRWGELLIRRREALMARSENRPERHIGPQEMLLSVFDLSRMGALRFKTDPNGEFLNNETSLAAPPHTSLRDLQHASLEFEKGMYRGDTMEAKWLSMLFAPGASLGGARPKANVTIDNELWIAKFPSRKDSYDMALWEMITYKMATLCGVLTAPCRMEKFGKSHHTFLTKRFDRQGDKRIHFASAMTMLNRIDGDNASEGASYLEIVDFLSAEGADTDADLRQLWTRIAFNIAVSNTDDHLRNHGFLLTPKGWRLSPAYDINPEPDGTGLQLNISENDNSLSFDLALSVAEYFRLKPREAEGIIDNIRSKTAQWRKIARSFGASRQEIGMMERAFRDKP